jgi:hypothetical protein
MGFGASRALQPMVAIDPDRCREILAELDRLAILELEAMAMGR